MAYFRTPLHREIKIDSIITIHYFEYMKDFVFKGESHNFWEFLYVDKGSVIVTADEDEHVMHAGSVIFHQPNEFHAIRAIGNASPNLVAVSFTTDSPAASYLCKKVCTLSKDERIMISHLINAASDAFSTPLNLPSVEQVIPDPAAPFASQQLVLIYLELFLVTIIRSQPDVSPTPSAKPEVPAHDNPNIKERRVESIIEYMQLHTCDHLTVSDICNEFSISRSSLQSIFHTEKGCGAMEYFNNLKIERAKTIMRDGTMNLTEIAYFLSYSSLQYFSRQFKKATGMSPLEYSSSVKGITQALKGSSPRR